VSLIIDRWVIARTPGTLRTEVITTGVDPQVNCYCRLSRIKQYFHEHRAPAHRDGGSGIGRRTAENWNALLAVGEAATQRLYDALATDARPAPDVLTFVEARPSAIDGQDAPGLRFGDPRVMAVMAAISGFTHLLAGFDNAALVRLASTLLDRPYPSGRRTHRHHKVKLGLTVNFAATKRLALAGLFGLHRIDDGE
jgi:hypothetical protein